jgi:hypothetical protein
MELAPIAVGIPGALVDQSPKYKAPGSEEPGAYRAGEGIRTLDVNLGNVISGS